MIPDGTGPATFTLGRELKKVMTPGLEHLAIDEILIGTAHTYSSDSLVTDSAAGATAYASGVKTYNGALGVIGVNNDASEVLPVGTIFEAAKQQKGMIVGTVVTSRITHATPAAFTAHIADRNLEDDIAEQQASADVDFMLGGGRRHFNSRGDGQDLLQKLRDDGFEVGTTRADFDAFANRETGFPYWGLWADSHLEYQIDNPASDQPNLVEQVDATLAHLEGLADSGPGFLMMIEGSRIDHAGHDNDIATHAIEVAIYDDVVARVLEFQRAHPNTLVISVADHETGGISLGRDGDYWYYPETLLTQTVSAQRAAPRLLALETPEERAAEFTLMSGIVLSQVGRCVGVGVLLIKLSGCASTVKWPTIHRGDNIRFCFS